MSLAQWIATAGGLGLAPIAPGTFGSVAGVLVFLCAFWIGAGHPGLAACLQLGLVLSLFGVGVWAAGRAEREWARRDDQRIVIDEVVGQLIALSPLVWFFRDGGRLTESPSEAFLFSLSPFFLSVVTGFVLFRVFDVWKPGAIRGAERRFEGGLGVMADDVVAGVYSAIVLCVGLGLNLGLHLGLGLGADMSTGLAGRHAFGAEALA